MGGDAEGVCPFCRPPADQVFHRGTLVLGLWDAFPVSRGHALLVPMRHVPSWFEASRAEQHELIEALEIARHVVTEQCSPHGFNVGINIGKTAGQTVPHLHVHLIPRYDGDVSDPRGGVRWVIPAKANYLIERPAGTDLLPGLPHERSLIRGDQDPLLPHLLGHLRTSIAADVAVAFVLRSGVDRIYAHLQDLLTSGGRLRLLAGDYLDVTEPEALHRLLDLEGRVELRVFETAGVGGVMSFHPKAYILYGPSGGGGVAFVGSSNLSATALGNGVEWNYRVVSSVDSKGGFAHIEQGFEQLFRHERTRLLDADWIGRYAARRRPVSAAPVELLPEPPPPVPDPHAVQREALLALEATRLTGNAAGLVVLATGLGKTWLSAFDSNRDQYRRVLFVAHREEILAQAMATFRRIRPAARLGRYTGTQKDLSADVLFASVQTLGRQRHLGQFARGAFDYLIVDEFHHAAAPIYRRLIDHFTPRFLLGLTATPERTDGGDLLSLCGENLVYRCDLAEGIRRGLLCPFKYFGVPDEVDYANIPWRSSRFDEEELTKAVATQKRSENVLEQYRKLAGRRTLAFCVSQSHADYTADFLRRSGVKALAVHAGPASAPRAATLEQLEAGTIDLVCAVDMFNEGVDLPEVDTVMMLRPTESRVLFLQQLGRGLRVAEGKPHLTVVDYIGNHRSFLLKPRALLGLGDGYRDVALAIERLQAGTFDLPPGCEVTYDLRAIDLLRDLLPQGSAPDVIEAFYLEFRDRLGVRPTATECHHEGYNPRALRRAHGSWLRFVDRMGDLPDLERRLLDRHGAFFDALEITPLTKSFKLVTLMAMIAAQRFPGRMSIDELTDNFIRIVERSAILKAEVGVDLGDRTAVARMLEENPITAWAGGRGTRGEQFFAYERGVFRSTFEVPNDQRFAFAEMARELVEWRLAEYLDRNPGSPVDATATAAEEFLATVSQAGDRPILFLPDRQKVPHVPEGTVPLRVEDEVLEARFVKIALNVVRRPGDSENQLPAILRGWFGPDAGRPGTSHRVRFRRDGEAWTMEPLSLGNRAQDAEPAGPQLWRSYMREEIPPLFGLKFSTAIWNVGFVKRPGHLFLLVTLQKEDMPADFRYDDRFLSPELFQWHSQNRTAKDSTHGQDLMHHANRVLAVHLFVRRSKKVGQAAAPFIYCGDISFVEWEGDRPITITWRLPSPVPEHLRRSLLVPG